MKYIEKALNSFESIEELKSYILENKINCKEDFITEKEKSDDVVDDDDKKGNSVLSDDYEVNYANSDVSNIFEHILIFTTSKEKSKNKTLKNIYDSLKIFKKAKTVVPKLHIFDVETVQYEDKDGTNILIYDDDEEFNIDSTIDNTNTLVFSRLGAIKFDRSQEIVSLLQDRGFLVLNPNTSSKLASNKYQTAVLLKKANIPQPNFCLITKDILYNEKLYIKSLRNVYKDFENDPEKDEKLTFVVKILDGHGGTGVVLLNGKLIKPVLELVFAIDPERELIVQKKEEADGGDIRVHVLTMKDRQVIIGAMKRVKIKGDFRSNVSLGATAEAVKLTQEQEQIALKCAMISKLPWCAVDIMPLVKRSNPELGDNVVLEINSSPGTDGISDVLEENFIVKMLSELTDPSKFLIQEKTSGYIESIDIDFEETSVCFLAKLDTGNGSAASHLEVGKYDVDGDNVTFTLNDKEIKTKIVGKSKAKVGEVVHERLLIEIPSIKIGNRRIKNIKMGIVEKRDKSTNVLLNRDAISSLGYTVSPNSTHLLSKEMEKVKII